MKKVLVVLSSVRPVSAGDNVLVEVKKELDKRSGIEYSVVDFRRQPLPLFDGNASPATEEYEPTNENVVAWNKAVEKADNVLVVSAEYNYSYTGALKNAIDSVSVSIWENKPVSFIGYGWSGGVKGINKTRALLTEYISAKPLEAEANLRFTKEINLGGEALNSVAVRESINKVLDEIEEQR